MSISEVQKRHLRALGHHLKPVVWIGQHGLGANVLAEIDSALDAHELVKLKIAADRDERAVVAQQICRQTGAEPVHAIGHMLVLFRRNTKRPKIALPSQ